MTCAEASEPFLSFYGKHGISPVSQDISDPEKHYNRRFRLYCSLGIPPSAVRDKQVLELGPGSGHNALFIRDLDPRRYVLVEGNPTGLERSKALLGQDGPLEFVHSRIQDFCSPDKFDLVLCEGVIPHQAEPAGMARHVGSFVKPGGILVLTTADYISVFSETLRRAICGTLVRQGDPIQVQLDRLLPIFRSHFDSLPGTSRPLEDWVLDTLITDDQWNHALFSFPDAVKALGAEFDVYGTSPKFLTDWRWYKHLDCPNDRAIAQYHASALALLDGRSGPASGGESIPRLCKKAFWESKRIREASTPDCRALVDICVEIMLALPRPHVYLIEALLEVVDYLRNRTNPMTSFHHLKSWFGHGQQYVSFIRPL